MWLWHFYKSKTRLWSIHNNKYIELAIIINKCGVRNICACIVHENIDYLRLKKHAVRLQNQCSRIPVLLMSSESTLVLLRFSHWLYMNPSWDRYDSYATIWARQVSNWLRIESCTLDELSNKLCPQIIITQQTVSRHCRASLIKQVSVYVVKSKCTSDGHTCAIWCNPEQHHLCKLQSENICQTNTFLTHCRHKLMEVSGFSGLFAEMQYIVKVYASNTQQHGFVYSSKKRKASWNNIFALYWESGHWTMNCCWNVKAVKKHNAGIDEQAVCSLFLSRLWI